jgi:hypothetical protein
MHQILRVRNLGHLWKQQQARRIFRAFPTLLLQWKNRSPAQHAYVVHPAESKRTPPATPFYYFGYAKGLLSVFRGDGQCGVFLLSTGWGMHAGCYPGMELCIRFVERLNLCFFACSRIPFIYTEPQNFGRTVKERCY